MKLRISAFAAAVVIIAALVGVYTPLGVSAAEHRSTVNLLNVRQNESGEGYYWKNTTDTLTLTDIRIITEDRYGLRIPDGATVILVGDNVINASYAALDVEGAVVFKGTGSLTLISGDIGFLNSTQSKSARVKIMEGTYVIKAGGRGIVSENAEWSLTGGSVSVESGSEAAFCRVLNLMGGSLTANGALHATSDLTAAYCALDITAPTAALTSDKKLTLRGLVLRTGEALTPVKEYAGETRVTATPASRARTTSLLFGKGVSIVADYLTAAAAVLVIATIIIVPRLIKKKRLAAAVAAYNAEQAARDAAKKAERTDRRSR